MKDNKTINKKLISQLRGISEKINQDFGVSKIGIFGSYSRGEERVNSDIDILVEFNKPINLFEFSRLRVFLSNQLGINVDLVTPGALKPMIKESVLSSVSYI